MGIFFRISFIKSNKSIFLRKPSTLLYNPHETPLIIENTNTQRGFSDPSIQWFRQCHKPFIIKSYSGLSVTSSVVLEALISAGFLKELLISVKSLVFSELLLC